LELVGLLLNFKRGSWFCAALLAGGFVLSHARWRTGVLLLASIALLTALPPVRTRLAQLNREFNVEGGGRLTMWCRVTPALIQAHPSGVGYGALTNERMRKAYRRVEPNRNHVHANWAQVLVETGWLGLTVYAAWMLWLLGASVAWVRSARYGAVTLHAVALAAFMGLAGLLMNGLVEYNFGDAELMMVLAVLAGLIATRSRWQRESKSGQ
jgi:O-antigen ligase